MSLRYTGTATDFYVAPPATADVVNLAIDLGRPLLVEGEPGCGKTQLAYSIAAELGLGPVVKISVKSNSRAQDLLYRLNALARLQDAQRHDVQQARHVYPYLSLGPLGEVIHKRERRVVLIDEVDKADIDFPNDLLDVLDTFSFQVDDLPPEEERLSLAQPGGFGRTVQGDRHQPPVVVITSNREKRLPEPFLRRCLYVRVSFPRTEEELREIVRRNTHDTLPQLVDAVLNAAVASFLRVRQLAVGNTQKPPTTSELIDWVRIVHWRGQSPEDLAADPYSPPYWETMFKTMGDLDAYQALVAAKAGKA
ncbi:MoxR family ATPase [Variovorax sp. J22R115]|uniref:AAA family ATPase n=1 Tax=Variovorax sp. J22R115 TaxID=3053509 RepID=UPI0025764B0A|nr:MoxR family ATPase [Variovorax sp. J22R115]MDM0048612.1 MoxR family ATPase [Variovorax sp. J22R115]